MNNEEAKHDINEFNNLKNQLDSLWKELEKDNDDENPLFSGNDKSSFIWHLLAPDLARKADRSCGGQIASTENNLTLSYLLTLPS